VTSHHVRYLRRPEDATVPFFFPPETSFCPTVLSSTPESRADCLSRSRCASPFLLTPLSMPRRQTSRVSIRRWCSDCRRAALLALTVYTSLVPLNPMLCLVTVASHWVWVGVLWSSKLFRIATEAIEFRPLPQKLKSTETMEMDSSGLIPRGLRGLPRRLGRGTLNTS
jgi:hypothetical protein